ncbi:MAG: ABC transporter ATP-binding protein [Lachnospiraceae bacterium]|nr:ABC transporter ATP-binding protein [Lachnospiraceae bacterium]
MDELLLEVTQASFSYGKEEPIFQNVDLTLKKGEILTILGPNGAGKSTLLSCISGFHKVSHGILRIGGQDLYKTAPKQLARQIGFVPQNQIKTYEFSVREYIAMGRAPYLRFGQSPSKADYQMVDEVMEQMNLLPLAEKSYTKLSGGECQQVLIARVLVQQPQIIMLDEPVNHLDYGNQLKILRLLKQLSARSFGIILTSHMPDHALLLEGTIGIMDREGNFTLGTAKTLLHEEQLQTLYGEKICRTYVEQAKREACIPYPL